MKNKNLTPSNSTELKPHKHAKIILEWSRHLASGEAYAGWWQLQAEHRVENFVYLEDVGDRVAWNLENYKIVKTALHPDNAIAERKPKLKLIEWAKMPIGTMTDKGEIRGRLYNSILIECNLINGSTAVYHAITDLRLAEQTNFTYWGGGECPVPAGVIVECVFRSGDVSLTMQGVEFEWMHPTKKDWSDLIGYRIVGVAEGYTDDPSKAAGEA